MASEPALMSPDPLRAGVRSPRLDACHADWREVIRCTQPVDRAEAERRIRAMYACAATESSRRIAVPRIIWVPSPLAGFRAAGQIVNATLLQVIQRAQEPDSADDMPDWQRDVCAAFPDLDTRLHTVLASNAFAAVVEDVADYGFDASADRRAIADTLFASVDDEASRLFADPPPIALPDLASFGRAMDLIAMEAQEAAIATGGPLWSRRRRSLYDHGWAYPYSGVHNWSDSTILALDGLIPRGFAEFEPPWRIALDILRACPFWWAFNGVAIACERPVRLSLDDEDRLHAGDGPAVEFSDGFRLHVWHGTVVPDSVILAMSRLSPDLIDATEHTEHRRLMLEQYGVERYLHETGATVIDVDQVEITRGSGDFMPRCLLRDRSGRQFLEATDGSTGRCYLMPVAANATTCREAHASICGYDESHCLTQT